MKFHEDDRGQRLFDIFTVKGQVNVIYVNSTKHIVAWHMHPKKQTDFWICLKGSFKIGLVENGKVKFEYLSDKNFKVLEINPGIWHGYKALEPNSIMLYYLTEKWDINDELKCLPGAFGENWETISK